MKFFFYDSHSKVIIKNCLRMYLGGNPVIMWSKTYNGFYLKIVFVLIPKIKALPLCSCSSVEEHYWMHFLLRPLSKFPTTLPSLAHSFTLLWRASLIFGQSSPPSSSPLCRHSLKLIAPSLFDNCSFECILLFVHYSLWVWSLFGMGIVFKTFFSSINFGFL